MAKFIKSAANIEDWINDQVTEFCFVGRSNVGKSTLINALAKSEIAKTSKTPGRTQLVNFYDFADFRIVDLPGYGFANTNKLKQQSITMIIDKYLAYRTNLYAIFQVCDANVITELDQQMSIYFNSRFKNHFVILNKIDKQNLNLYVSKLSKIAKYLHVDVNSLLLVSAKKQKNINQIYLKMKNLAKKVK